MACITREPNGCRRIEFNFPGERKRRKIRLGKMNLRSAEGVKSKVEQLISSVASGYGWDNETAEWVGRIGDDLADKLAAHRLIPPRERIICPPLKEFAVALRNSRPNLKPNTAAQLRSDDSPIGRSLWRRSVTRFD